MPDSYSPFGMTGMPGANTGGTNMAVPTPAGNNTPAIGGSTNPFLPQYPQGNNTAPITSSVNLAGIDPNTLLGNHPLKRNDPTKSSNDGDGGLSGGQKLLGAMAPLLFGFMGGKTPNPGQKNALGDWVPNQKDFVKAMKKSGYSAGVAAMLFNFLQSGAGYNPDVANALIDAQRPGVQRKEADILEQFSAMGLRNGSPAAISMGDFLAQQQLNEGQIFAGLYEQAVQNYMSVLMGGKGQQAPSTFDNIMKFISTSAQTAASFATAGQKPK